jgi:exonuclease III
MPTIFVSNIRSIAPKIDELECVVNQNDSDIVCITETWLSDEIPDNAVAMHGFTLFRKDRETRGGGVAIFVKPIFNVKDYQFLTFLSP